MTGADSEHASCVQANPGNRLLQVRGNAGTHDLALGTQTLEALHGANSGDSNGAAELAVPRYDKSRNGGRGDRAEPAAWPRVQGPLDIVLFEGWMLGFRPVSDAHAQQVWRGIWLLWATDHVPCQQPLKLLSCCLCPLSFLCTPIVSALCVIPPCLLCPRGQDAAL